MNSTRHSFFELCHRSLSLAPGVQGFMDWGTGIIRLNCSQADYARRLALPFSKGGVREVFVHETHHFAQILICSFLYAHSARLNALVECLLLNAHTGWTDSVQLLVLAREYRDSCVRIEDPLDSGCSPRDIVESLTHFLQVRAIHSINASEYYSLLSKSNIPDTYKRAYFLFYYYLGDNDTVFPFIAQLSLCFESPAAAFCRLLQDWGGPRLNGDTPLPDVMDHCRSEYEGFMGFSWECEQRQPVYDEVLRAIVRANADEQFSLTMMNPVKIWEPGIDDFFIRPLVLNPTLSQGSPVFMNYPIVRRGKISGPDDLERTLTTMCLGHEVTQQSNLVEHLIERYTSK